MRNFHCVALPLCLSFTAMAAVAEEPAPLQAPSSQVANSPQLRVQLSASRRTVLSSELAGKVLELDVKEGASFKKGQRLVTFDCAVHRAQLTHSAAAEAAAGKKLDVARRLDKLQSISVSDLSQAQAEVNMARAQRGVGQVMVQRCAIDAPFSGRVAERKAQPGEYVAEGEELLAIYDDSSFEVELIVPSHWMVWLKPGHRFKVRLEETAQEYPAEVTRLGSVIDPISQSIKVFGRITSNDPQLLPGMSGNALLVPPDAPRP
ncbi:MULTISPECIES: efflux RND transporter periplasmic adaptor subunit [Pseudomonas]|jgi:membrane fusion protein (multidrug efflux system)|nr:MULTISPECIES: efflux RND transporter periplasmic adaptor subunit [Pseudomonas]MCS3514905.1 RND family efflux transporter MFP subunit [Pseudomonas grimontii]SEC13276.1 RND family efflux transporter, MFP subunit [Pseudomonas marginalis]